MEVLAGHCKRGGREVETDIRAYPMERWVARDWGQRVGDKANTARE